MPLFEQKVAQKLGEQKKLVPAKAGIMAKFLASLLKIICRYACDNYSSRSRQKLAQYFLMLAGMQYSSNASKAVLKNPGTKPSGTKRCLTPLRGRQGKFFAEPLFSLKK